MPASEWPIDSLQTLLDLRRKQGGVILWSLGRCATASLADTLVSSGAMRYCRGRKESFSSAQGVSASGLESCAGLVAHVKPQHLWRATSSIRSPSAFVHAARPHFEILVVVRRQNHLARLVSSFENRLGEKQLTVDAGKGIALRFFATPLRTIEWESDMLEEGAQTAKELYRHVFEFDFTYLTSSLCEAVDRILSAVHASSRWSNNRTTECTPRISHVRITPRRFGTLEDRVGIEAAALIRNDLRETAYEWMLDLNASEWPHPRPEPKPPQLDGPRPQHTNTTTSRKKRKRTGAKGRRRTRPVL